MSVQHGMSSAEVPADGLDRRGLVRALLLGPLWQSRGRLALSLAAIALGVALGFAVQLVNQSAINEFSQAVQTLSGVADLEVRGPRAGFDEALYPRLAQRPEVAVASPVIEVEARIAGRRESLRVLGIDVFHAALVQPELVASTASDSLDTLRPDVIFVSAVAAAELGLKEGDTLSLQAGLDEVPFRVAGIVSADRTRVALMDIAGAQAAFDRLGRLSRIDLRLRPGVDVAEFRERLAREVPAGVQVERPDANVARSANMTRSYRVNLNVLALVALFTGGLLVFSTQALAVVRRRPQLALLRVLGVTRGGLVAMLIAEALLVGVAGAALGLVGGYALAQVVLNLVGADLGAGYFRGVRAALTVDPWAGAVFFAIGVGVALAGSLAPALEASRTPPASALRAGDEQRLFHRLRPAWPGLVLIIAGALLTLLPPVTGLPVFGYAAIALLLVGAILLMPRVAVVAYRILRLPRRPPLDLALAQLRGAPGQSMLSLATIVASVSLLVSMSVMVASFRNSLDAWLERVLPADLYVRTTGVGETGYLTPRDQANLERIPGVRRADFLRAQNVYLAADRPPVSLLARPVDAQEAGTRLPLISAVHLPKPGEPPPIWVTEAVQDLYGFNVGATVEVPVGGEARRFTVAGVWRDYGRVQGAILIDRALYVSLTGDRNANDAALWLQPGADAGAVREAIRATMPGGDRMDIAEPGEIRALSLRTFDRTFAVTYALELVALVIGLTGLSSSFGALVLARRREFGMLRHVGMTRRQIGAMLATEGALVSALGLAVGLALGWLISLILIHVVNRQSFHWGMDLHIPWLAIGAFSVVMLGLASATALVSARQAMTDDAARAVKDDW